MKRLQKVAYVTMGLLMGLSVAFSPIAFAASGTKTLQATFRNIKLVVDGKTVTPKDGNGNIVEPFVVDGTTYLPVRAVGEAFGKPVNWDGNTNTVYIGNAPNEPSKPVVSSETVKLTSLDYLTKEGTDFEFKEQQQANTGDYFNDCFVYDLGVAVYTKEGTRDYLLNGQYKMISGTIFLTYEGRASSAVSKFSLWGDGKLIYTSEDIKAGSMPQSFNVDVSGVSVLKIGYGEAAWGDNWEQSWFATSNVILQKK